jgi:hypothetical protein
MSKEFDKLDCNDCSFDDPTFCSKCKEVFLAGQKSITDRKCKECKYGKQYDCTLMLSAMLVVCTNEKVQNYDSGGEYPVVVDSTFYCKHWKPKGDQK